MDYHWHYDYARLACDTGFVFGGSQPSTLDKNKLSFFDVDRVVKERDINIIEQYIPLVIHYVLDDQAEILDSNFVKIFRISQLAIEYLLFCKKYLDNTVVLLKKEMTKLKQQLNLMKYNEDVETNISLNPRREILTAVYRCEKCEKAFSTENYLNSHIKRRHSRSDTDHNGDQLQTEIKELKERLNSTDKLLQEFNSPVQPPGPNNVDPNLFLDLEKKFQLFKEQIENEISTLHVEKNIYEEKYTKLFDLILQFKDKPNVIMESTGTMTSDENILKAEQKKSIRTDADSHDIPRQTKFRKLKEETVQILSIQECDEERKEVCSEKNTNEIIQEKLNILSTDIETKISKSMDMINGQMQTFWEQIKKEKTNEGDNIHKEKYSQQTEDSVEIVKPQVKPRTKFTNMVKISGNPEEKTRELSLITRIQPTEIDDSQHSDYTQFIYKNPVMTESNLKTISPRDTVEESSLTESLSTLNISKDEMNINKNSPKILEKKNNYQSQVQLMYQLNKIMQDRFPGKPSPLIAVEVCQQQYDMAKKILSSHNYLNNSKMKQNKNETKKKLAIRISKLEKQCPKTNVVRVHLKRSIKNEPDEFSEQKTAHKLDINKTVFESDSVTDTTSPPKKSVTNDMKLRSPKTIQNTEKEQFFKQINSANSTIRKKVVFETLPSATGDVTHQNVSAKTPPNEDNISSDFNLSDL